MSGEQMTIAQQGLRPDRVLRALLLLLICLCTAPALRAQDRSAIALPASTGSRLALVVGIDNYDNVTPLQKANNDATAVSETLASVGFKVTRVLDADRRSLNRAVSHFSAEIRPGDEVVFYFAGHGIEVNGRNYLLPADVPSALPGDEEFVVSESIAADRVLSGFRARGARVTLLILDACRNNPFPTNAQRSLGGASGLARMDPPEGSFILFSAGSGQTALDRLSDGDPDPNSVFTRALLPRLRQQGMAIHDLVRAVRTDVRDMAGTVQHNQFPAYYDQLSGDFSFNPAAASMAAPALQATEPQPQAAPRAIDPCDRARSDWQVLATTESAEALKAFLRKYPDCPIYLAAAEERLATLLAPSAPTPPAQLAVPAGDSCFNLWYARNLIFHQKGFCFQSDKAKQYFDTSRCTTRSPRLTAAEKQQVEMLQATEKAQGC